MNLRTIACITLLTDGMGLEETTPSTPEAHTLESLKTDLGDIGLNADEDLQPLLEELIRRGYVLAEANSFFPGKPAVSMPRYWPHLPRMMVPPFWATSSRPSMRCPPGASCWKRCTPVRPNPEDAGDSSEAQVRAAGPEEG